MSGYDQRLNGDACGALSMQGVLEQHYSAKVREMEVRLELAQAKQRQADLAAAEQRARAEEAAASYKQAIDAPHNSQSKGPAIDSTRQNSCAAMYKQANDLQSSESKVSALSSGRQKRLLPERTPSGVLCHP